MTKEYSRIEIYLDKIKNNDINNLPIPQSRVDYFLKSIIDGDTSTLPNPQSRVEEYLDYLARNNSNSGNNSDEWIIHNTKIYEVIDFIKINFNFGMNENIHIELIDAI